MERRDHGFPKGGADWQKALRRFAQLALCAVMVAGALLLHCEPAFIRPLAWISIVGALCVGFFAPHAAVFAFGFILPVAPFLRSWALISCAAALAVGLWRKAPALDSSAKAMLYALCLFGLPVLIGSAYTLHIDGDLLLYRALWREGLLDRYLSAVQPSAYRALLLSVSLATAWCCVPMLALSSEREKLFRAGLAAGIVLSLSLLAGQLAAVHPAFDLNRGPFFIHARQFAAGFSDPNAFGVFAAIAAPLLILTGSRWERITGLAFAFCALWSGSRSYLLGLIIWLALFLVSRIPRSAGRARTVSIGVCALFGLALVSLSIPAVNNRLQPVSPPALQRALRTVNAVTVQEMLYSRALYLRLGLRVWQDSPLAGVGAARFYFAQDAAAQDLGIRLGNWRDNANNFYLQTLAESGLLGLLAALIGLAAMIYLARCSGAYFYALSVMALLLITGPHINFEEIALLMAALCGFAIRPSANDERVAYRLKLCCVAAAVMLSVAALFNAVRAPDAPRGIYQAESGPEGRTVWTAAQAEFPSCASERRFELRAVHPDLGTHPVRVELSADGSRISAELMRPEWKSVPVPGSSAPVRLSVSRTWSPFKQKLGADPRALGVMLRLQSLKCGS